MEKKRKKKRQTLSTNKVFQINVIVCAVLSGKSFLKTIINIPLKTLANKKPYLHPIRGEGKMPWHWTVSLIAAYPMLGWISVPFKLGLKLLRKIVRCNYPSNCLAPMYTGLWASPLIKICHFAMICNNTLTAFIAFLVFS